MYFLNGAWIQKSDFILINIIGNAREIFGVKVNEHLLEGQQKMRTSQIPSLHVLNCAFLCSVLFSPNLQNCI